MRITRFLLSVLGAFAVWPNLAIAEKVNDNTPFSMLCVTDADKNIGFNWVNGDWAPTRFKPTTFVINRLERKSCNLPPLPDPNSPTEEQLLEELAPEGCYEIKEMGEKTLFGPQRCFEYGLDKPGGAPTRIGCTGDQEFRAEIDGAFAMTRTYAVISKEKDGQKILSFWR